MWRFAAAALLFACGNREIVSEARQRIVGGMPTGNAHNEVVLVTTQTGARTKQCTGTLIAQNLVVTALHCVSTANPMVGFVCNSMGMDVSGGTASLLGPQAAPELVSVYTGEVPGTPAARVLEIVSSGSSTICENDIAFLVLDQALPLPTAVVHRGAATALGASLTIV